MMTQSVLEILGTLSPALLGIALVVVAFNQRHLIKRIDKLEDAQDSKLTPTKLKALGTNSLYAASTQQTTNPPALLTEQIKTTWVQPGSMLVVRLPYPILKLEHVAQNVQAIYNWAEEWGVHFILLPDVVQIAHMDTTVEDDGDDGDEDEIEPEAPEPADGVDRGEKYNVH